MSAPNLPGFVSNKPRTTVRPHTFRVVNGIVFEKENPAAAYSESDHKARIAAEATAKATLPTREKEMLVTAKLTSGASAPEIPVEVELERQVLRFQSYFKEAVHESPLEDYRVRRVDILFYLVDAAIQVIEHEEHNSGLLQGTMLKRHRISKSVTPTGDVEYYSWQDLVIGNEVTFYGRTYMIVNCDAATRSWFQERGYDQGPAAEIPMDAAATARKAGERKEHYGKVMYPTKKFMEARLGKTIEDPEKLRRFLENDRKVLRFDAVWDDTSSLYGDKNMYIITYFLSNDQVEIREAKVHNSGKDPFPTLLSRQPLPKDFVAAKEAGPPQDNPHLYYRCTDFVIGRTLNILGRDVLIRSCDAFTRQYFADVLGTPQPPPLVEHAEEERKVTAAIPPPTGYGDEEDSLASFYSLVPKVPKKDFNMYMEKDGVIFRFMAQLENPIPEDEMRRFVIAVYAQDNTIGVYEPPIRNSGIVGGKFLARGKHHKPDGTTFSPADFTIGEVTEVCRRRFLVTDMDEKTRRMLASM